MACKLVPGAHGQALAPGTNRAWALVGHHLEQLLESSGSVTQP